MSSDSAESLADVKTDCANLLLLVCNKMHV